MQIREMQFISGGNYAQRNNFHLRGSDFTGIVLEKDWTGNFSGGVELKDGKIIGTLSNNTTSPGGRTDARSCYILEIAFYYQACAGGWCAEYKYLYTDSYQVCVDSDGGRDIDYLTPIGSLNSSDGNGSGPGVDRNDEYLAATPVDDAGVLTTIVLPRIKDELKNPCLKSVLLKLQNKGFKKDVNRILSTVFGITDDVDIKFIENPTLPATTDGQTHPKGGLNYDQLNKQVYGEISIELNPVALANATSEYVAITMLHEAIHAYIAYRNAFLIGINERSAVIEIMEHDVMAVGYVNAMKEAILEAFPSYPPEWAEAIAWGGLGKTASWNVMNSAKKNEILRKNQVEKGLVPIAGVSSVGTKCK